MKPANRKHPQNGYRAALAPYSVWSFLFIVVPLAFIAYYAFTDNQFAFTTENVTRFFTATSNIVQDDGTSVEVRTYLLIFMRSVKLAVISTVICLLIGQAVKASAVDSKWIPIICGVCGLGLGIAAMYIMPDFPATDYITAAAIGIVSGLAATGANQAVRQLNE